MRIRVPHPFVFLASIGTALVLGLSIPGLGNARTLAAVQQQDARPSFEQWLAGVREEALERGISLAVVQQALDGLEPLEVVLERDQAQAEFTLELGDYLARRLTPRLIRQAREAAGTHARLLNRVSDTYGVAPQVLVSVWGLESNFGRFSGVRPTIAALATLAYDPRRADFFRSQLFDALTILERGDIELANLKGSWAGAMGQPQFMPSSYLRFAQDFDGDNRRDIWRSLPDVFASMAAYLQAHGWKEGERWGREVRVPAAARKLAEEAPLREAGCSAVRNMSQPLPLSRWQALGVRLPGGGALPSARVDASLVRAGKRSFLVYRNYEAILAYNCAHTYALSVGLLSDRIGAVRPAAARPAKPAKPTRK